MLAGTNKRGWKVTLMAFCLAVLTLYRKAFYLLAKHGTLGYLSSAHVAKSLVVQDEDAAAAETN